MSGITREPSLEGTHF